MEMGNYEQYVLMKPFVELGIKKNLRDVKALVSQIEKKLLPYLTQDFDKPKRSLNVAAQAGWDNDDGDIIYITTKK
uniref:Phage protein n=1 Tax=Strongyloides papillosus TaxID=174720 RepID=A0A0N5BVC4_STREA